jgi:hypothetical protein
LDLFGRGVQKIDLEEVKFYLGVLKEQMLMINRVTITEEQQLMLKAAYKRKIEQLDTRPLVIPRDMEVLCRLVNVMSVVNEKSAARDEDVLRAIDLWDDMIFTRKQLYKQGNGILTPKQLILRELQESPDGKISTKALRGKHKELFSGPSFYRYIKELESSGEVQYLAKGTERSILTLPSRFLLSREKTKEDNR